MAFIEEDVRRPPRDMTGVFRKIYEVSPGGHIRGVERVEPVSPDDDDAERTGGLFFQLSPCEPCEPLPTVLQSQSDLKLPCTQSLMHTNERR